MPLKQTIKREKGKWLREDLFLIAVQPRALKQDCYRCSNVWTETKYLLFTKFCFSFLSVKVRDSVIVKLGYTFRMCVSCRASIRTVFITLLQITKYLGKYKLQKPKTYCIHRLHQGVLNPKFHQDTWNI